VLVCFCVVVELDSNVMGLGEVKGQGTIVLPPDTGKFARMVL